MSLPWVRLDSNIASHDKTLKALGMRGGKGAMTVYMFALAWSGGHSTDGHIPPAALAMLHGSPADAGVLVRSGLWDEDPKGDGWWIHNYAQRQELALVTEVKRRAQRLAAIRTNCVRWHGPDCNCWQAAE
jgi:hypothetical protein